MKNKYLKKLMMITMILVSNNYLIRKINYSIQKRNFINILRPINGYIYIINFFKTILNLHLKMVTSFLNNEISVLMEMGRKEIRFLSIFFNSSNSF